MPVRSSALDVIAKMDRFWLEFPRCVPALANVTVRIPRCLSISLRITCARHAETCFDWARLSFLRIYAMAMRSLNSERNQVDL